MFPACRANWCSVSKKLTPRGMERPKKFRIWLAMMSMAAPAVKPTTTVWEMKFTRVPRRAAPIASCITPTMKVRVSTRPTY